MPTRRPPLRAPSASSSTSPHVDYINSTGIALIVRLLAEARRDHRVVIAEGLTDHYREIFRITRLSDYLTIADPEPATSIPEEAAR